MRKILIVGLGGSGGKTLAFIMDELKSTLRDAGWQKERLPECWKFVHIDVPKKADTEGLGLAESVEKLGGKYIGLANGSKYRDYDDVNLKNFEKSSQGLRSYARWRPDPRLKTTDIDIDGGAGAFRAIGRVVTLAQASGIYSALVEVVKSLSLPSADHDEQALGELFRSSSQQNSDEKPLVLLVSSIAGGSGASMILDVADILRGINPPQFGGEHSAAFLYTADVFKSNTGIYEGAAAGSLATMSELVNAAADSNAFDEEHWRTILPKVSKPADMSAGRGPGIVFPIGAETHGVPFGSSPEEVYRGFAKMLSPIFYNEDAQTHLRSYVQTNWQKTVEINSIDATGLFTNNSQGKSFKRSMLFGTWGSATLTIGRDRYKEYAAQRIGREVASVLMEGFREHGESLLSLEESITKKSRAVYPTFIELLDLGADGTLGWQTDGKLAISVIRGMAERDSSIRLLTQPVREVLSGARSRQSITALIRAKLNQDSAEIDRKLAELSISEVSVWLKGLTQRLDLAILYVLSEGGFEAAKRVLEDFRSQLARVQTGLNANSSNRLKAADEALSKILNSPAKGNVIEKPDSDHSKNLSTKYEGVIKGKLEERTSLLLSRVLEDISNKMIPELIRALEISSRELKAELLSTEKIATSAAYRDAPITTWPRGSAVPAQFNPTVNEVVLTGLDEYDEAFTTHINTESGLSGADSLRAVASKIIFRRNLLPGGKTSLLPGLPSEEGSIHPSLSSNSLTWKPPALNNGSSLNPKYSFMFSSAGIRKIVFEYLGVTGSSFEIFTRQTIADWLSADPLHDGIFRAKLSTAISYASPLVSIDSKAVIKFHGNGYEEINYSFSSIPISSQSPAIKGICSAWGAGKSSNRNSNELQGACDPSSSAKEVFISSETPPYSPWVFSSLTSPIKDRFAGLSAKHAAEKWTFVRSRPLRQFVPLGSDLVDAFLRGWLVGRISGLVQFESANEGSPFKIYVHSLKEGSKSPSSFGPVTLGATALNLVATDTGQDSSGWNIPAILLESLPFALASAATNESLLQPYLDLIDLGSDLKEGPILSEIDGMNALDLWFLASDRLPNSQFRFMEQTRPGAERLEATKTWLSESIEMLKQIDSIKLTEQTFYSIDPVFEIASELISACTVVLRELNRANLGRPASPGSFFSPKMGESAPHNSIPRTEA